MEELVDSRLQRFEQMRRRTALLELPRPPHAAPASPGPPFRCPQVMWGWEEENGVLIRRLDNATGPEACCDLCGSYRQAARPEGTSSLSRP